MSEETPVITIDSDEDLDLFCANPENEEMLRRSLWYEGCLSHALRAHGQTWLYDFIERRWEEDPGPRPFVVETHRRFGKSHWLILRAVERCLRWPGQRFVYGLPTLEDWKDIGVPNLAKVLEDCPDELRPNKSGYEYTFFNPAWGKKRAFSTLTVAGINSDKNAGRGGGCDEACVDEAGYVDHLEYWISDVVGPQFSERHRQTLILSSTPPETMDHPFISKFCREAIAFNRYIGLPGSKNPDFRDEDKMLLHQVVGPEDSIAWRREIEIEHVTDPEAMIVPEFIDMKDEIVREHKRPTYYYPMDVADLGWADRTHILFGYVDFEESKLIIEDEISMNYATPKEIAEKWEEKDKALWAGSPPPDMGVGPKYVQSYMAHLQRHSDGNPLTLAGLSMDHGLLVGSVVKTDAEENAASLRAKIGSGRIIIHPRCKQLIYQLENGIRDENGKWKRSESLGHCDGIAALGYFNRMARWHHNPIPNKRKHNRNIGRKAISSKKKRHPLAQAWKGE